MKGKTKMKYLFTLLVLVGCASAPTPEPYLRIDQDIARACLRECGPDSYVKKWGIFEGKLSCKCEKVKAAVKK